MTRIVLDGGTGHGKGGDMRQAIQVSGTAAIANPKVLLSGSLEAGIVAFTFGTQSISALEAGTVFVNGKTVIVREVNFPSFHTSTMIRPSKSPDNIALKIGNIRLRMHF